MTGDEKCTTCMDDVGTYKEISTEKEISGIGDEQILMEEKALTKR